MREITCIVGRVYDDVLVPFDVANLGFVFLEDLVLMIR